MVLSHVNLSFLNFLYYSHFPPICLFFCFFYDFSKCCFFFSFFNFLTFDNFFILWREGELVFLFPGRPLCRTAPPTHRPSPDCPKFRAVFSLFRRKCRSFFSLGSFRGLWQQFKAEFHTKCAFGLLGPQGLANRGHNSTKRLPERRKNEICDGSRKKKREMLGSPPSALPTLGVFTFSGFSSFFHYCHFACALVLFLILFLFIFLVFSSFFDLLNVSLFLSFFVCFCFLSKKTKTFFLCFSFFAREGGRREANPNPNPPKPQPPPCKPVSAVACVELTVTGTASRLSKKRPQTYMGMEISGMTAQRMLVPSKSQRRCQHPRQSPHLDDADQRTSLTACQ